MLQTSSKLIAVDCTAAKQKTVLLNRKNRKQFASIQLQNQRWQLLSLAIFSFLSLKVVSQFWVASFLKLQVLCPLDVLVQNFCIQNETVTSQDTMMHPGITGLSMKLNNNTGF